MTKPTKKKTLRPKSNGFVEPSSSPLLGEKNGRVSSIGELAGSHVSRVKIVSVAPPVLGEDAYHGLMGEFLRGVAPYTEATDAAVLAHLIPAVGTLIGPGPTFYAGNDQPARVNSVVVGDTSSGRKGTSSYPPDKLMEDVAPDLWHLIRAGGLSSGEGLIARVADKRDKEGKPIPAEKRAYVLEEEFARVLANTRREGNILSAVIRQAFDSGNLATMTVEPRQGVRSAHLDCGAYPRRTNWPSDSLESKQPTGSATAFCGSTSPATS